MKVLIVGAGIGGLTLGAFLKECEIDFDIVEKSADWSRKGYSIGLWSNGRKMLEKLKLADRLDERGERIKHFYINDGQGNLLKQYNHNEFYERYGTGYVHINRAELHSWLLEKTGEEKIQLNTTIVSLTQETEEVVAVFSDGTSQRYDFVIGADGVHSQVRKLVFDEQDFEHFIQWRVWYVWIDNQFKQLQSIKQYVAPAQYISIFDDKEKTLCVLFAPASHAEWDTPEDRIERLRKYFSDCTAVMPAILDNVSADDIVPTDLAAVKMKRWYSGRVALLGDAAHAMEPFAGLGGSMAMEDAYVLAGELLKKKEGSTENPLEAYEHIRMKRVNQARAITHGMKWWSLVRSRLFRKIFNMIGSHMPVALFTHEFHQLLSEDI